MKKDKVAPTIPSHPVGFIQTAPNETFNWYGLTKREYFAIECLSAIIGSEVFRENDPDDDVSSAITYADKLIKGLNGE